jgi:hypothetical protein
LMGATFSGDTAAGSVKLFHCAKGTASSKTTREGRLCSFMLDFEKRWT